MKRKAYIDFNLTIVWFSQIHWKLVSILRMK